MNITTDQLFEVIGDAIIVTGTNNEILHWNPAAERIFGYTANEVIGQSLDIIIPEPQRKAHGSGYNTTMTTGKTRYATDVLRVPAVHKSGDRLSISFTVALILSKTEPYKPKAVVAVVRDETKRFQQERDLRKRLLEAENKINELSD